MLLLETAPVDWSTTSPPLKRMSVGMARMPKRLGLAEFSSTFILQILTLPSSSVASSSTIGPMPTESFKPKVIAQDKAGNEATQSINILAIPKVFKSDKLNIPDSFLNDKMSQYSSMYPELKTPIDIYKRVNTELRKQNVDELLKIGLDTSPTPLWTGAFLRLPAAAGRAGFGDQRDYYYNGEKIDHETHMGVDLASVANAPVPAANAGRIVYAGFFGIYGNCVIIDHGLGLQSLYSHLSQIDVAKGTMVKKGQIIAKTGATGLAGGDHLHFGMDVIPRGCAPVALASGAGRHHTPYGPDSVRKSAGGASCPCRSSSRNPQGKHRSRPCWSSRPWPKSSAPWLADRSDGAA